MPIFDFGSFQLFTEQRVLLEAGVPVRLGKRAFDLLVLLVERAGEVITKDEIARHVWRPSNVLEANIRVHIAALRQVLGAGRPGARFITNVANRGYCFVGEVQEAYVNPAAKPASLEIEAMPPSLIRVIGRSQVIDTVASILWSRRLLSIVGPGGIGKTTVARGVIERVAGSLERRVAFVDLAPVADPALVPSVTSTALGLAAASVPPLLTLLSHLQGAPFLIVLDNCEHLVAAVARMAEELLKGASEVRILTTSRESLKAEGEFVHRLTALQVPSQDTPVGASDAMRFPAVELFVERARACVDSFILTDDNVATVAMICRRLDGIPLAIELAAATMNVFGVHALATHLADNFALLTRGRRTALPRQRTLRATLDWSYDLLSAGEQALLRRLGTFAGPFNLDAAHSVSSAPDDDESEVLNDLGNLVDKSLVVLDPRGDDFSFRLLDSTRTYALEKLAAVNELDTAARQHARHFCELLQRMAGGDGHSFESGSLDLRPILDNVRAALDWTSGPQGDAQITITLTMAAIPLWAQLSLTNECVDRIRQARALYQRGDFEDAALEIELWLAEGISLLYTRGPQPDAGEALKRAVALERSRPRTEDVDRMMRTHNALGLYFNVRSEPRSSLAIGWQLYRHLRSMKNHPAQAIAQYMIGTALHSLGAQRAALEHLDEAIVRYDKPSRARLTQQLFMDRLTSSRVIRAWTLWLLGLPDQASRQADAAVDDADHVLSRCFALCDGVGTMALLCGDVAKLHHATRALSVVLQKNQLPTWRLHREIFASILAVREAATADRLAELHRFITEWATETGYRHRLSMLIAVLVECLITAGRVDDARPILAPILVQGERGQIDWFMAELLRIDGELCLREHTRRGAELAARRFDESLAWARKQHALGWELRSAMSLARMWCAQGDNVRAYTLLAPIYERFTEGHSTEDLRSAQTLLTNLSESHMTHVPGCLGN